MHGYYEIYINLNDEEIENYKINGEEFLKKISATISFQAKKFEDRFIEVDRGY